MVLATILVGVVVPLIIGPLSVFCKSLWDRYSKIQELKLKNRYEMKMSQLSDKINLFYWPVYLKLKTLDRINYQLKKNSPEPCNYTLNMGSLLETSLTDNTEYSSDGEKKIRNRRKKKKIICSQDNCFQINHNPNLSPICHKCRMIDKSKLNKTNTNSSLKEMSRLDGTSIILGNQMTDSEIEEENDENLNISIETKSLEWEPEPIDISRNRFQSMRKIELHDDLEVEENNLLVTVDKNFLQMLDSKILKITHDIKSLIEKNIAIIQPSKNLVREMIKFTRYAEMFDILHHSSEENKKKHRIEDLGVVNNTRRLINLVKVDLEKYMAEYENTFESYNNVNVQTCCSRK